MLGLKKKRRRELMRTPLSADSIAIVRRNVPYVAKLAPDDQTELQGLMQVFLDEKRFEGCAGLEITDEIRVTIAAQACDRHSNLVGYLQARTPQAPVHPRLPACIRCEGPSHERRARRDRRSRGPCRRVVGARQHRVVVGCCASGRVRCPRRPQRGVPRVCAPVGPGRLWGTWSSNAPKAFDVPRVGTSAQR